MHNTSNKKSQILFKVGLQNDEPNNNNKKMRYAYTGKNTELAHSLRLVNYYYAL